MGQYFGIYRFGIINKDMGGVISILSNNRLFYSTLYVRMDKNDSGAIERQKSGRKMADASAGSFRHSTCSRWWVMIWMERDDMGDMDGMD